MDYLKICCTISKGDSSDTSFYFNSAVVRERTLYYFDLLGFTGTSLVTIDTF